MGSRLLLLIAAFFLAASAVAEPADVPAAVNGYVTRVASPTDFDVNGVRVVCVDKTHFAEQRSVGLANLSGPGTLYVGEPARVYGSLNKKAHTVAAQTVVTEPAEVRPVSGRAIIDRVLSSQSEMEVRADGYPILITAKTASSFAAPLKSMADVGTNVWIAYQGKQRADGVVVAEKAVFTPNVVGGTEGKVREHNEYDPAAVDPEKKQGVLNRAFGHYDPKKFPPYKDDAMQERVDRIGASLVPEYQRALPDSDATKIHFRFQLIDTDRFLAGMPLASGIILVPKQLVERLQNDSQLAAVLADNIAITLEKQDYRELLAQEKMTAAQFAGDAAGIFVPGVGIATIVANGKVAAAMRRRQEQQSVRVSLDLMRDAGYDVYEAPRAWWVLARKHAMDLGGTQMPVLTGDAYRALGSTWREGKAE